MRPTTPGTCAASRRTAPPLLPLFVTLVVALVVAAAAARVPPASGAFTAALTNDAVTAGTGRWDTCDVAVPEVPPAYLAYSFGEPAGATLAADASGNSRTGAYSTSGVSLGTPSGDLCPRDPRTVATFDGSTGEVASPRLGHLTSDAPFTEEVWFRTTRAGGKLIGFGDQPTGGSAVYDRQLYLTDACTLRFGVRPAGNVVLASTTSVCDGAWHHAAGAMSSAGTVLYLDGAVVATSSNTRAQDHTSGYWRIGGDSVSGWTDAPSRSHVTGDLAWAAVYTQALSATQVARHWAAGRP